MGKSSELTSSEPYEPEDPDMKPDVVIVRDPQRRSVDDSLEARVPTGLVAPSAQRKAYQQRLDDIMDKMATGTALSADDAAFAVNCTLLLVMRESRRSSHQLKAAQTLMTAQVKQILDNTRNVEGVVLKGPKPSLPS